MTVHNNGLELFTEHAALGIDLIDCKKQDVAKEVSLIAFVR